MKALTVLRRAAALMDKGRWIQGEFHKQGRRINVRTGKRAISGREVHCYCAAGALKAVAPHIKQDDERYKAFHFLNLAIDRKIKFASVEEHDEEAVWDWNDNKRRTVGQVRRAFHRAIR